MKLIVFLALLAACPTAQSGKWSDFCQRHIFTDDPYEGEEIIQEAMALYPDDATRVRRFLRDTYYLEINQPRPRRSITNAIEAFFGGKP
jgi:hypothetical protein